MCLIVDTNVASKFFRAQEFPEALPLWKWVNGPRGCLVYGGTDLEREYKRVNEAQRVLRSLKQAGRAIEADRSQVDRVRDELLEEESCRSNDQHIIALARVSGSRLLYSEENWNFLLDDFKNPVLINKPRGKIYKRSEHKDLLKRVAKCRYARISNYRQR